MQKNENDDWNPSAYPGLIRTLTRESNLYAILEKTHFEDVTEFVERFPVEWYTDLAKRLDSKVMPVVLMQAHALEAVQRHKVREYAMAFIVRGLRHYLPQGWTHQKDAPLDIHTVGAIADVIGKLRAAGCNSEERESCNRAWQAILRLCPPLGWVPQDVKDSLITKAFDEVWPVK